MLRKTPISKPKQATVIVVLLIVITTLGVTCVGLRWYRQHTTRLYRQGQFFDDDAVIDPESGQWTLNNELAIFADKHTLDEVLKLYDAKITISIPETNTYQVRFQVSSLEELKIIRQELENSGVDVILVPLIGQL